jgi:hypothetical protein
VHGRSCRFLSVRNRVKTLATWPYITNEHIVAKPYPSNLAVQVTYPSNSRIFENVLRDSCEMNVWLPRNIEVSLLANLHQPSIDTDHRLSGC